MESSAAPLAPLRSRVRSRLGRVPPIYWVVLALVAYAAIAFTFSWLRALNFGLTTWDDGIYQQALWSTAHGRPFWETPDYETGGFSSLLQVHSVFLLYLVVPLYAAFPSPWTLLALQAAVVAIAAVPLYLLARDLTGSGHWGMLAALAYLVWTPTLGANLYDFHAEAFLPLEVFTVVLLWNRGRYAWGFVATAIACLTFELAPILLFFVGVLFLLPSSATWAHWWALLRAGRPRARAFRQVLSEAVQKLASRRGMCCLGLLLATAAAYELLVLVRQDYLSAWLGIGAYPAHAFGYVAGTTPAGLQLSASYLAYSFGTKIESWLVFLALLGFVPLFAPRTLVLSIPWLVFSFFIGDANYVAFGYQYGFIVGSGLLVGFAFGLVPIAHWVDGRRPADRRPAPRAEIEAWVASVDARSSRRVRRRAIVLCGIAVVVALNLALSPTDPLLENAPYGAAYSFSFTPAPGFGAVERLVTLLPANAEVLATTDLFPFVANDVNAYSFIYATNQNPLLPFNVTSEPPYVLISWSQSYLLPTWIESTVYNPGVYGVLGIVWSTPDGAVVLFELHYHGPATSFDLPPSVVGTYYGGSPPASGPYSGAIYPGGSGSLETLPSSPGGAAVVATPGEEGLVGSGPGVDLPVGNYSIRVLVSAWAWDPATPPPGAEPVLTVDSNVWPQPDWFDRTYTYGELENGTSEGGPGPWTTIEFNVTVVEPSLGFEVRGWSTSLGAIVAIGSVTIGWA